MLALPRQLLIWSRKLHVNYYLSNNFCKSTEILQIRSHKQVYQILESRLCNVKCNYYFNFKTLRYARLTWSIL